MSKTIKKSAECWCDCHDVADQPLGCAACRKKHVPHDRPQYGHQYALTGARGVKCILNGNTWGESEVFVR
jgi:hypothetical protein